MREKLNQRVREIDELDSYENKIAKIDQLQKEIAPEFLNAEQILNEVPIWPMIINIFSACFCMGCSAIYHMMFVKSESY